MLFLLISLAFIICGILQINSEAASRSSAAVLSREELSDYQKILDKLNEEYNLSMSFAPELFSPDNPFDSPKNKSLEEFEASLRADIETCIATTNEAKARIAALGDDVEWKPVPNIEKIYTLPVNISYLNSQTPSGVKSGAMSFREDFEEFMAKQEVSTANASTTGKTITSIQPQFISGTISVFLINSTVSIEGNWKYSTISGFSTMILNSSGPKYIPTSATYSFSDSNRTASLTFTCKYYSTDGTLLNSNCLVYCDYYVTGDCITNWPNYTISKVVTNQTYRHIDDFDDTLNCAGYAWNYPGFVGQELLGITFDELNQCSNLSQFRLLVKNKSESFMRNNKISATVIDAYNTSINTSTQYRVVMRVGYYDSNGDGEWNFGIYPESDYCDFHWWMQLGDGSWADKRGLYPSRIVPLSNIYTNPIISSWRWDVSSLGQVMYDSFYSSEPVYYKITG